MLFYTQITLQHAVHEATRFPVTGSSLPDPDTGDPMSRAESIKRVTRQQAVALDLDVDRLEIDPPDGGGPSQVVTIRGGFSFEFIVPGIKRSTPSLRTSWCA